MRSMNAAVMTGLFVLMSPGALLAQSPQSANAITVPRLINVTGVFAPADGKRLGREVVTIAIYADETGGEPLWHETQSIDVDPSGRYMVLLGATQPEGVPPDVFASGEPRWLGVAWARPGEVDGPRTRFTSVPYALRASDADTLGGRPASAYVLSPTAGGEGTTSTGTAVSIVPNVVNPGTTNFLAKYVTPDDVGNSAVYESGGFVGINTTSPLDILHSRFTNTNGALTGIAVQNLGSTATSYSGMLFYDHLGALGQFQGFNNSTHEYRINNIATGGSINFMIGSSSKFLVASNGNVGIGVSSPTQNLVVAGSIATNGGDFRPLGTQFDGIRWVDDAGTIQAHMHRFGAVDDRLYITNAGTSNLTGVYLASGATSLTSTSDERLKSDIEPVTGILDKIKNIRVVGFNMASLSVDKTTGKAVVNREIPKRTMKNGRVIKHQIGSIAQDWLANFPELVVEPQTDAQFYGLDYDRIGVVALGAVKELTNLVNQKDTEIQALNARLAALEQMLQQLKGEIQRQPQPKQE
jgi:hypothetical protein